MKYLVFPKRGTMCSYVVMLQYMITKKESLVVENHRDMRTGCESVRLEELDIRKGVTEFKICALMKFLNLLAGAMDGVRSNKPGEGWSCLATTQRQRALLSCKSTEKLRRRATGCTRCCK